MTQIETSAQSTRPSKIVIAGGSGFLGVSLAQHLAQAGHSVVLFSQDTAEMLRALETRNVGCAFAGGLANRT